MRDLLGGTHWASCQGQQLRTSLCRAEDQQRDLPVPQPGQERLWAGAQRPKAQPPGQWGGSGHARPRRAAPAQPGAHDRVSPGPRRRHAHAPAGEGGKVDCKQPYSLILTMHGCPLWIACVHNVGPGEHQQGHSTMPSTVQPDTHKAWVLLGCGLHASCGARAAALLTWGLLPSASTCAAGLR